MPPETRDSRCVVELLVLRLSLLHVAEEGVCPCRVLGLRVAPVMVMAANRQSSVALGTYLHAANLGTAGREGRTRTGSPARLTARRLQGRPVMWGDCLCRSPPSPPSRITPLPHTCHVGLKGKQWKGLRRRDPTVRLSHGG